MSLLRRKLEEVILPNVWPHFYQNNEVGKFDIGYIYIYIYNIYNIYIYIYIYIYIIYICNMYCLGINIICIYSSPFHLSTAQSL